MSPAKHLKTPMAPYGFGFEFKLASKWQCELDTCPQRGKGTMKQEWVWPPVSVLCWREADRCHKLLLSLMCGPSRQQTRQTHPSVLRLPSETLQNTVGNNCLHTGLPQLRSISENEHTAQPPVSAYRSCCLPSASLGQFETLRTNLKQQEN